MYSTSKLSLGKRAQLADMCKEDFIKYLSSRGHSLFNWDDEELETELTTIQKILKEQAYESNN